MDSGIEKAAMRKVYLRLLPLTMLMYLLCYIDRINVSFAALTMNRDIGLTAAAYGFSWLCQVGGPWPAWQPARHDELAQSLPRLPVSG